MRRLLVIFVLIALALAGVVAWAEQEIRRPYRNFPDAGVYIDVPHGASRRAVARILADQGVVANRWLFELLARARPKRTLQAGEYFFDRPSTPLEVFDKVAAGRIFVRELVVPEGFSSFEIADLVEREGLTTRQDFLAAVRDPSLVHNFAPQAPSLEGFLFPATYLVPRHLSGHDLVAEMVRHFQQQWATVSTQGGNAAGLSVQQVVTLASLVERETPQPDERPLVAGVFLNRLDHGIPLQCDPTVVYAMELAEAFSGKLEARDLTFDSQYNTYRNRGLPPGPIANPGAMSLRAALDPSHTDMVYFVANTQGGHIFSRTLAEHNRNVAHYRELLAQQRRAARIGSAKAADSSPERSQ
jgi:UPF0755 protein